MLALALAVNMALAVTPEQAYVAARDAQIDRLTAEAHQAGGPTDLDRDEQAARGELAKQLRALVGPFTFATAKHPGALTLSLYRGDADSGGLDVLLFHRKGSTWRVTTDSLLRRWLRENVHRSSEGPMPSEPREAGRLGRFYTFALGADAAVTRHAELPVQPPQGTDFAVAILASQSSDEPSVKADQVLVMVGAGGRIFIGSAPVTAMGPVPVCSLGETRRATPAGLQTCLDEIARTLPQIESADAAAQALVNAAAPQD